MPASDPAVPALLTIAHGTRNPLGEQEMNTLQELLREQHGAVANGWLEDFATPSVADAFGSLAAGGARTVVTVPFLNFGAYHAKTDVPSALAQAAAAHPGVRILHGRPLGLHSSLFELARRRVAAAIPDGASDSDVLVVTGSGSSDPDANSDLAKAARFLAEGTGHRWVEHAFAGVTWPSVGDVLARVAAAGARRAVLFSWSLLAGLLEQRVSSAAEKAAAETGLAIVDAGRFGPDPLVAHTVTERYREALDGDVRMNCDLCAYRVPLPGREDRVGAPSAGGTGRRARRA